MDGLAREGKLPVSKKYLFLFGADYSYALSNIELDSVYAVVPVNEPLYASTNQEQLFSLLGKRVYTVDYDQINLIKIIKQINPDFVICMGWRRIFKNGIFGLKNKIINIHPALLPDYRGYHTEPYVIMNNESHHGITAHFMDRKVDSGDIIYQEKYKINEYSTVKSLRHIVEQNMPVFLMRLIGMLETESYTIIKQDANRVKIVAKKRVPEDSQVDSEKSLNELYDSIRACDPEKFPAFFYRNGEKIYVRLWRDLKGKDDVYDL